jgi:SAM-dependent methyltransferase
MVPPRRKAGIAPLGAAGSVADDDDDDPVAPTDPVTAQYEMWPYPAPIEDLEAWRRDGGYDGADPSRLYPAYWPDRDYPREIDVLVAGCGTNQAAIIAYQNPLARVVGIDVSRTSLAHEERLKRRHGLDNLSCQRLEVEQAHRLQQRFDLVVAIGVLHHLEDPERGLRVLGELLKPDGVVVAMVYGTYGRIGVTLLQGLFRELGLGRRASDVAIVRDTLDRLPPGHPVHTYLQGAPDLGWDAGLVDTFLHARDRTFTVDECLALVAGAGLRFQGWVENGAYHPEGQIPEESRLFQRLARLGGPSLWRSMEAVNGGIAMHVFLACRPDHPLASYRVDFSGPSLLQCTPILRAGVVQTDGPTDSDTPLVLEREHGPAVRLAAVDAALVRQVDGNRNVQAIIAGAEHSAGADVEQRARRLFRDLWRRGYLWLRLLPEASG